MPDDSDTIAQRVTVIGGDRLANAYVGPVGANFRPMQSSKW
jgi:hypothetical protein